MTDKFHFMTEPTHRRRPQPSDRDAACWMSAHSVLCALLT